MNFNFILKTHSFVNLRFLIGLSLLFDPIILIITAPLAHRFYLNTIDCPIFIILFFLFTQTTSTTFYFFSTSFFFFHTMADTIPEIIKDKISPKALETLAKVKHFVETECIPADTIFHAQISADPAKRWATYPKIMEELKTKAKAQGLWNLFLPSYYKESAGYTNLEYALMAEQMGRTFTGPETFNCAAPDTGNMEVFARYGNEEQKKQYLGPLMNGEIRSAFCMTERFVASSDARNIQLQITVDEKTDEYILNGRKWYASGAGDPRCKVWLVMGRVVDGEGKAASENPYLQQSVVIVPAHHPGSKVIRAMGVYGYDDAPHGHCEIDFTNCRIPRKNMVLGEGRGFEIIQGRLGPGRIHHCMRTLGAAEEGLRWMIWRVHDPSRRAFGKLLRDHETIVFNIAKSRMEIDGARLLVLAAAHLMDKEGPKAALSDIAKAKVVCPNVCLDVLDRAIQSFGAEGISQDTPLAYMWAGNRTLRLADGPDEVHTFQLGKTELKRYAKIKQEFDVTFEKIKPFKHHL